jgi:hypothetical protein
VQRALEEGSSLGNARYLIVDDERGWALHAPDLLHRKTTQMRGTLLLPVALAARLRTIDPPPRGEPLGAERAGMQGPIGCKRVVGGDHGDREVGNVRIADFPVGAADGKICQHRQPVGVDQAVAGKMCTRCKSHAQMWPAIETPMSVARMSATALRAGAIHSRASVSGSGIRGRSTRMTAAKPCCG